MKHGSLVVERLLRCFSNACLAGTEGTKVSRGSRCDGVEQLEDNATYSDTSNCYVEEAARRLRSGVRLGHFGSLQIETCLFFADNLRSSLNLLEIF